mmetsp:Transcript_29783/g.70010  ORF Transcript_29783/g.70010 Transcript_29783/m.70010 type:complete len:254 (-) Transcript_29783:215-976(-)
MAAATEDLVALLDYLDVQQANVIGHDWGGGIAWHLAMTYPDRVKRLAVLNCPHPAAFAQVAQSNPGQILKSWYMFLFQLPTLPEWRASKDRFAWLINFGFGTAAPGVYSQADLEAYREAWGQPGSLTAMMDYYRDAIRNIADPEREAHTRTRVQVPTLIVWGDKDHYLDPMLAHASAAWCDAGRVAVVSGASHWLPNERPAEVNAHLRRFLLAPAGDLVERLINLEILLANSLNIKTPKLFQSPESSQGGATA